jgi:hypothetical protein
MILQYKESQLSNGLLSTPYSHTHKVKAPWFDS